MVLAGSRRAGIAKALAITCLVAGQGISRAEPPPVDGKCDSEASTELVVPIPETSVTFQCGEDFAIIASHERANIYTEESNSEDSTLTLDTLIQGATREDQHSKSKIYTPHIHDPTKRPPGGRTLYYLCEGSSCMIKMQGHSVAADGTTRWVVTIIVEGQTKPGTPAPQTTPIPTEPSRPTKPDTQVPPADVLEHCGWENNRIETRTRSHVFDVADCNCQDKQPLDAVLPGASLKPCLLPTPTVAHLMC